MESKAVILCAVLFCYGLVRNLPKYITLTATEDIVAGSLLQSSFVMILLSSADLLGKISTPFLVRRISILLCTALAVFIWLISYILIVAAGDVIVRLVAVFLCGIGNGITMNTVVLVLGCYDEVETNLSAYQIGTNFSTLVAGLFYTGFTVWGCFSPRLTIAILYPLGFLAVPLIAILTHGPLKECQSEKCKNPDNEYKPLPTDENTNKPSQSLWFHRLQFFFKVFPFASYYFLNYFVYYLGANSVLTTLTFPSAPFRVRDHYQYYRFTGDIGTIIGGAELLLVSCLCPGWLNFIRIRKIWILVSLNVGHLVVLVFASWYRFVPNVYIVLVLCGTQGILFGSIAVRSIAAAADRFTSSHDRGIAMSIVEIACTIGRLISGLLGIFVEEYLRKHCTNELLNGKFCLARFPSNVGWKENLECS